MIRNLDLTFFWIDVNFGRIIQSLSFTDLLDFVILALEKGKEFIRSRIK